jgi:hypothetical protein
MGSYLNPGSFAYYAGHWVMAPESERGLEGLKDSERTGHQTIHWTDLMVHNFGYYEN